MAATQCQGLTLAQSEYQEIFVHEKTDTLTCPPWIPTGTSSGPGEAGSRHTWAQHKGVPGRPLVPPETRPPRKHAWVTVPSRRARSHRGPGARARRLCGCQAPSNQLRTDLLTLPRHRLLSVPSCGTLFSRLSKKPAPRHSLSRSPTSSMRGAPPPHACTRKAGRNPEQAVMKSLPPETVWADTSKSFPN